MPDDSLTPEVLPGSTKFVSKRVPPEKLTEFMRLAREHYEYDRQIDSEERELAMDDVRFCAALPVKDAGTTQWQEESARARIAAFRPVLTENRLPMFTAQVVNDGRQSKPAIKITAGDNGTKETAEYYQSRIRQIEYDSDADIAYDTGREQQVTSGRAFLRVTWRYAPGTNRKEARIEPIGNQFSVVFGPCKEYDCSDAEHCFVISLITKEEHERAHGKDTTLAHSDFAGDANPAPGWFGVGADGRMVQKAEYWLKEYKSRNRCTLSNGAEYWEDEIPEGVLAMGVTIAETRPEQDITVVQYIIDGADILDETEFIVPHIGIVPIWGRESYVDGVRRTTSLIRYAKDPQRLLNLYVSNIAEQIALMPKAVWWMPVGSVPAGQENVLANLNNSPKAYAQYVQYDSQGRQFNAPFRIQNEPFIQALVAGYMQAVDAIKASMGLFDASIGAISNETSGVAINSRKRESDNANFHFHGNEARSRKTVGRLLRMMIPILDKGIGNRMVRDEQGKTKIVRTGEPWKDPTTGKVVTIDLTKGDYSEAVDSGPSYTSQRQEAFATYWEILKANPQLLMVIGPSVFRMSDFPASDEIADLLEKMMPPQLQPQKPGQNQIPPQVLQKFQQLQQVAGQTIEQLTERVHELEAEQAAQKLQIEGRIRGIEIQEKTKLDIAAADRAHEEGLKLLMADLASIKHRLDLADAEADRQHAADLANQQRQHQAAMAQQGQQHEADQGAADRDHQMALAQAAPPAAPPAPGAPPAAASAETGETGSAETEPQTQE